MNVLVVGAGLAGLSLALCLLRRGHKPLVVERARQLRGEGYMIDFFGSGYDAAERLALLPALERVHYPIESLSFVRASGEVRMAIPYPRMRELLGGRHFNFMRGDLERVLLDALGGEQAPVRFGTTVESFTERSDRVTVRLSSGSIEDVDLLVGADGVHSRTRSLAFGAGPFVRELGYHAAAFLIEDDALREKLGPTFVTLSVLGKQVSVYPIRGGRVATFWIHRDDRPIPDSSNAAAIRELRDVYGSLGWLVPRLLERAERAPSVYFDTVSQVELPHWTRNRVALVGDSCQCVSLLAGQGASMAVGAAYVLAEEFDAHRGDTRAALASYEARIKPAIAKKQKAGRNVARWFVPESSARMAVRDLVLRASSSSLGGWLLKRQIAGESVLAKNGARSSDATS
jgi:2-polyprenyl-6-methoxyphenol hydroxylase-like FAD-dependent oxidoreductase